MKKVGNKVFIITGEQGAGKTNCLIDVVKHLQDKGFAIKGFLAIGYWADGIRSGFDLINIVTKESKILCRNICKKGDQKIGRFYFKPETIKFGNTILTSPINSTPGLTVIDEIGLFEIQGKLWSGSFSSLLKKKSNPLLITVRTSFLQQAISHFNLSNYHVFTYNEPPFEIAGSIVNMLN